MGHRLPELGLSRAVVFLLHNTDTEVTAPPMMHLMTPALPPTTPALTPTTPALPPTHPTAPALPPHNPHNPSTAPPQPPQPQHCPPHTPQPTPLLCISPAGVTPECSARSSHRLFGTPSCAVPYGIGWAAGARDVQSVFVLSKHQRSPRKTCCAAACCSRRRHASSRRRGSYKSGKPQNQWASPDTVQR